MDRVTRAYALMDVYEIPYSIECLFLSMVMGYFVTYVTVLLLVVAQRLFNVLKVIWSPLSDNLFVS